MENRLFRSSTDRMVGGVCAGLARYLQVDATLVRLFFVLLLIAGGGIGALVYLLLWIIVPVEGREQDASLQETVQTGSEEIAERAREVGEDLKGMVASPHPAAARWIGLGLVGLGLFILIQNLDLPWLNWLDIDVLWPVLLILAGIALLRRHFMK